MQLSLPWLGAALVLGLAAFTFYVAACEDDLLNKGWGFTDDDE